jgi:1-deoxy-D-xylulose-5-phosphate synthase
MVLHDFAAAGLLDAGLKIRTLVLPDRFGEHDAPARQYDEAGLNAAQIVAAALDALGRAWRNVAAGGG